MAESDIKEKRKTIVEKHRVHKQDTGSSDVQIALLTQRLEVLSDHFKRHPQDQHSQRGLFGVVSKRKRLLSYLKRQNTDRYRAVIDALGLRK